MLRRAGWHALTDVLEVRAVCIVTTLLTEVTGTWGTAVTFCQTARRNIPEG
jgi:hypothetical protein